MEDLCLSNQTLTGSKITAFPFFRNVLAKKKIAQKANSPLAYDLEPQRALELRFKNLLTEEATSSHPRAFTIVLILALQFLFEKTAILLFFIFCFRNFQVFFLKFVAAGSCFFRRID